MLNPGDTTSISASPERCSGSAMLSWSGRSSMCAGAAGRHASPPSPKPVVETSRAVRRSPNFLARPTILRSLILFNLLFAVQTVLDLVYLWGNAKLPAGISYADYAHRGAYPLIVTALLAAGFVLAAMRPGGPAERSKVIRPLVYLWVAQNVMLVVSSMLRLDLYVQIYLLTCWRVAAFIWMLLVAIGLLLIVARIILEQSNGWLVRDEPDQPDGNTLCLLADQFCRHHRGL